MDYRLSVSLVVVRGQGKDKEVLTVTSRKWGGSSLPGGKLDPGETFDQAAARELEEETGCRPTKLKQLGAVEHKPVASDPNRNHWLCMCYEAEIGDQEPRQSEEGTVPSWVPAKAVLDTNIYRDFTRQILLRVGLLKPPPPMSW